MASSENTQKENSMYLKFLIAITLVIPLCIAPPTQAESPKIGVIIALSGPIAFTGTNIKNGMVIAQQESGRDASAVIYEDDQFIPRKAVDAAKKLIEIDKVRGLIVFGSSTSIAVAEIAERAEIPMMAIAMTEKVVAGKHYVFQHFVSAPVQMELVKKETLRRGYRTVAIISSQQDAMLRMRDLFSQDAPAKIVLDETFVPGDVELRGVSTKVAHLNPDAVFLLLMPPQCSTAARFLREQGYKGDFVGGPPTGDPHEWKAANGALKGTWFVTPEIHSEDFRTAYRKQFGEIEIEDSGHGYDTMKLMHQALTKPDPIEYLATLKDFTGSLGTYSTNGMHGYAIIPGIHTVP
jgi:branched-chain amino acid transport system substrate-binding protein